MKIALISCGLTKHDKPTPAREMYDQGHFFNTMRNYAESNYDAYFILSGHYGVLEPSQIIEPYDDVVFFVQKIFRERAKKQGKTIKKLSKFEQDEWAKGVWEYTDWSRFEKVDFLINIYYWEPLKKYFEGCEKFEHIKFERRLGPNLKKYKIKE